MRRAIRDPESWTTSTELIVELDGRDETTKSARLRGALRDSIRSGRLEPGRRLPSSRALAADLGVSRGLVVETYEQLVAEGYLVAAHGSGTTVAHNAAEPSHRPTRPTDTAEWRVDFGPGTPDLASFPRSSWAAAVRTALRDLPDVDLAYRDPRGDDILRTELSAYLRRVRGAETDPSRLFIVAGFTHGLSLVARALVEAGTTHLAVEDPGAYVQRTAMIDAGLRVEPLPVDRDGALTDELAASRVGAAMVTPAHQYPMGGVLGPARRSKLLEWARSRPGRVVIEDDYDAEFRYDRSPVGTMHGLAPEHVVLGGSVSKSLAPALRMGWIAVPSAMAPVIEELQQVSYAYPSTIDQRALAILLASGRYDRHIRRARATYRTRRDVLVEGLSDVPGVVIGGIAAGLHLSIELPHHVDESAITVDLSARGVCAWGLDNYRIRPGHPGLVLGYAHLTLDQLREGASVVAETLRQHV